MRYLYADSEPFPSQYDFLGTFKGFIHCATRALAATASARELEERVAREAMGESGEIEALERFVAQVGQAVEMAATTANGRLVQALARRFRAELTRSAEESKADSHKALQQTRNEVEQQLEEHRDTTRDAISQFLLRDRVDVIDAVFQINLLDGNYDMSVACELPASLDVVYRLAPQRVDTWSQPRKVSDLIGPTELQVGMKKKWLKRDLTREIVQIGDHFISGATLGGDVAEVRLRRKGDTSDHILLRMQRTETGLETEIYRPGAEDDVPGGFPASVDDISKLEQLWTSVEAASRDAMPHKVAVLSVQLDGQDLFEEDLTTTFVDRYVALYAPIVREIVKRSPSQHEMSLKLEHEDGRREEIYLRKDELAELIGGLDDVMLATFAPLDIFPEVQVEAG